MSSDSGFEIFYSEFEGWVLEREMEGWVKQMRLQVEMVVWVFEKYQTDLLANEQSMLVKEPTSSGGGWLKLLWVGGLEIIGLERK